MIEKFNFYDIYGYFLPGSAFLALIWVPFGLIQHLWPAKELSSAVAAIIFAYVVGHVLRTLAHNVFPSQVKDPLRRPRFPSDLFLDSDNNTFSQEFKVRLAKIVMNTFEIDLAIGTTAAQVDDQIKRRRQDAFFSARGVLIKQGIATYAEQFEGMYALMRGLTTAFGFGFFYIAGWALSCFKNQCSRSTAVFIVIGGLGAASVLSSIVLSRQRKQKTPFHLEIANLSVLTIVLLALGYLLGFEKISTVEQGILLWVVSLGALFSSLRCFSTYKFFAGEFAKAVWRDFAAFMLTPARGSNPVSSG